MESVINTSVGRALRHFCCRGSTVMCASVASIFDVLLHRDLSEICPSVQPCPVKSTNSTLESKDIIAQIVFSKIHLWLINYLELEANCWLSGNFGRLVESYMCYSLNRNAKTGGEAIEQWCVCVLLLRFSLESLALLFPL